MKEKGHGTEAYYKRRKEIADCLYKKMKYTAYSSISISDLCEGVGLSRRSFYHYYQDKEDCLWGVVENFLHEYMLRTSEIKEDTELERAIALMKIWKSDLFCDFFGVFEKNHLLDVYVKCAVRFTKEVERYLSAPIAKEVLSLDEDIMCAYLAWDLALMTQWRKRGYDTSCEEMAKKYLSIERIV